MSWLYLIKTGELFDQGGHCESVGYSGKGICKNNPLMVNLRERGPIPPGAYSIGDPFNSDDHGPFCLRLTPYPINQMFGRDGFLIHGDSVKEPGTASEGCIIMPRSVREAIAKSSDRFLNVESGDITYITDQDITA